MNSNKSLQITSLILFAVVFLLSRPEISFSSALEFNRNFDPVVLHAESVKPFLGLDVKKIWLYSFQNDKYRPVHFQIDEVTTDDAFVYDLGLYPNPQDGNGILDAQDMISMRAIDVGEKGPADKSLWPAGTDKRLELELLNPQNSQKGYLSLFHFPDGVPSFYLTPPGHVTSDNPLSPETDYYKVVTTALGGNMSTLMWMEYYNLAAAGGTGVNMLDKMNASMRIRVMFGLIKYTVWENTLIGQTVAYRVGKVRGFGKCWMTARFPLGLKGPKVWINAICYPYFAVVPIRINIPFNPGAILTDTSTTVGFDLNHSAIGMKFYNSNNMEGFLIDGRMDEKEKKMDSSPDEWRFITGPQGTLMSMSVWDQGYLDQAKVNIKYIDDLKADDQTGSIPGVIGGHFTESTVEQLEPRSYGLVLFLMAPPHVYRPNAPPDFGIIRQFQNIRFQPIQVTTPAGSFENLAGYPPYHLPVKN